MRIVRPSDGEVRYLLQWRIGRPHDAEHALPRRLLGVRAVAAGARARGALLRVRPEAEDDGRVLRGQPQDGRRAAGGLPRRQLPLGQRRHR